MLPLLGMLAVVATWCLLASVFYGCGQLVCRIAKIQAAGWKNAHLVFWIGWATTIIGLQLWHIWFAVDYRILILVCLCGAFGLAWSTKPLINEARAKWKNDRRGFWRVILPLLTLVVVWSSLSIGPPHRPDTANYHLASVRWATTYPIVPGLGNLHHRLAFNNSSFLYAAMLDHGPWATRSHHLAHGLMAVVTMMFFMSRIQLARRTRSRRFPLHLMQALFFPIAVLSTYKGTSSLQPDLLTFLIGLVVASLLFECLMGYTTSKERLRLNLFGICLLSSVGLTVKLSFLVFGFLASCIALGIAWRFRSKPKIGPWSLTAACVLAAVVSILPWMSRHLILSGYPLYPSTVGAIDVPWKVPLQDVQTTKDSVVGYARMHGPGFMDTLDNWDWVGPVILRELGHPFTVTIPLLCTIFSVITWMWLPRKRTGMRVAKSLFLLPAVMAVLFMACTAPCPRFAGAAIWIIAVAAMVLCLDRIDRESLLFQRHFKLVRAVGLVLLAIGLIKAGRYANSPIGNAALVATPVGEVTQLYTKSGVMVHVAKEFAWQADLPNTPEFRPNLALLDPTDLRQGFYIDQNSITPIDIAWRQGTTR